MSRARRKQQPLKPPPWKALGNTTAVFIVLSAVSIAFARTPFGREQIALAQFNQDATLYPGSEHIASVKFETRLYTGSIIVYLFWTPENLESVQQHYIVEGYTQGTGNVLVPPGCLRDNRTIPIPECVTHWTVSPQDIREDMAYMLFEATVPENPLINRNRFMEKLDDFRAEHSDGTYVVYSRYVDFTYPFSETVF